MVKCKATILSTALEAAPTASRAVCTLSFAFFQNSNPALSTLFAKPTETYDIFTKSVPRKKGKAFYKK